MNDRWLVLSYDGTRWKIALDETSLEQAARAYESMKADALVVRLVWVGEEVLHG